MDECWEWTGAISNKGYGWLHCERRGMEARRVAVLDHGFIELVDSSMAKDSICVSAARICYQSKADNDVKDAALIARLMRSGHNTPFEHAVMQWHVKCPLFVARQWMRHRIGSFNEKSLRYCVADREYYVPVDKVEKPYYVTAIEHAFDTYEELVAKGWLREQARGVLPVAIYTEFIWTVNAWSLVNWLNKRLAKGAQWEHRQYAEVALELWADEMPIMAGAFLRTLDEKTQCRFLSCGDVGDVQDAG